MTRTVSNETVHYFFVLTVPARRRPCVTTAEVRRDTGARGRKQNLEGGQDFWIETTGRRSPPGECLSVPLVSRYFDVLTSAHTPGLSRSERHTPSGSTIG